MSMDKFKFWEKDLPLRASMVILGIGFLIFVGWLAYLATINAPKKPMDLHERTDVEVLHGCLSEGKSRSYVMEAYNIELIRRFELEAYEEPCVDYGEGNSMHRKALYNSWKKGDSQCVGVPLKLN